LIGVEIIGTTRHRLLRRGLRRGLGLRRRGGFILRSLPTTVSARRSLSARRMSSFIVPKPATTGKICWSSSRCCGSRCDRLQAIHPTCWPARP
jgi:hypothetical protein